MSWWHISPYPNQQMVIFPQRPQLTQLVMDHIFEEQEEDDGICF